MPLKKLACPHCGYTMILEHWGTRRRYRCTSSYFYTLSEAIGRDLAARPDDQAFSQQLSFEMDAHAIAAERAWYAYASSKERRRRDKVKRLGHANHNQGLTHS